MSRLMMFLMLSAVCAPLQAQDNKTDPFVIRQPFLWKITPTDSQGEDTKPGYLFGTIHVPDKSLTTLHPIAAKAWNESDAAFFEVDFLKNAGDQTNAISLPDGVRLEDQLSAELLKRLDDRLKKISPAFGRSILPNAHIAVWPLLLGNLEAQVRKLGQLPMDMKLYGEAKSQGKKVGGLEDPTKQLTPIIELPKKDQIEFLTATLDMMDDDERNGINRLEETMKLYAKGNVEEFSQFIEEEFRRTKMRKDLTDKIVKALLADRNSRMADKIADMMSKSPDQQFFFAVGVGHLTGKQTVQDFLKKKNIAAELVKAPQSVKAGTSADN